MTNRCQILLLCLLLFLIAAPSADAQSIRFNEVSASNSVHFDEDGDSPDWFELRNFGDETVSLTGWTVSDDAGKPGKWAFPDVVLSPGEHLLLWASGKDRPQFGVPRTLVDQGATFRYLIPSQSVSGQWRSPDFDDSGWDEGPSGFGYGDGDDATPAPAGTRVILLRHTFHLANAAAIRELILDVDYDDAFVAYINGVEVARANIQGVPPAFDVSPDADHEAAIYRGGTPERFVVDNPAGLLQTGKNVLCIQAHNVSGSSSDMTIIPFLSAIYAGAATEGTPPPELLRLAQQSLHTNFQISSAGETLYLRDPAGNLADSLQIEDLPHNVSLGLPPGGGGPVYYDAPTPGLPNGDVWFAGVSSAVIAFSHPGGPTDVLNLTLSGVAPLDTIRYTLDATIPNERSPVYTGPISIVANTVVRARVFRPNYLPSETQSHTYLVGVSHRLPIIALVTEPHNFFDRDHGIYVFGDSYENKFPYFGANFWEDWERPIHFTLYELDGSLGLAFNAGTKVFGGWSRGHPQRSLSIFARKQYGLGEINYPLFPDQPYEAYQSLVLRNSGNDWLYTMLRDAALTSLMKGAGLDYQAYRPAAAYLNGEYWGFYNMREKVSEHFLAAKHDLDPDDIDLLENNGRTIHGDNRDYQNLLAFVAARDLSQDNNYRQVAGEIDIENYIIYQVAQIYFDNTDWPGNNIKFWRSKGGKWRWILFDTDFGFGIWNVNNLHNNTLAFALADDGPNWPNPPWATLLFRKLVQNIEFRNAFVNRFADELNSRFLPERVHRHIDTLAAVIAPEIPAHYQRWEGSVPFWNTQLNNMRRFASGRPFQMKQHIRSVFGLPDYHRLTINNEDPTMGHVKVNRLTIRENLWTGDYFQDVPIKVVAVAAPGYTFSHWSGGSISTSAEVEINMTEALTLTPHFKTAPPPAKPIVINEINYSSADYLDTEDWLELYNPNISPVDLSNWTLKDSDDEHRFVLPPGALIGGGGYLILCRDAARFRSIYPDINPTTGDFDFGLSGEEDMVRLYDATGALVDSVHYLSVAPWPEGAVGTTATIELRNPSLDNTLPQSWAILHTAGSPGKANFIERDTSGQTGDGVLAEVKYFPNPFRDQLTLTFRLQKSTRVKGLLYDAKGALAHPIFDGDLPAGEYRLERELSFLTPGVYFLKLTAGAEETQVVKWVKM